MPKRELELYSIPSIPLRHLRDGNGQALSEVKGHGLEVKGHGSEVKGHGSEGPGSVANFMPLIPLDFNWNLHCI